MSKDHFTIVGLGELLWDLLPEGKQLGGAPANFAYIANLLGDCGIVASRIGTDDLGKELLAKLQNSSLPTFAIQHDSSRPTGTVKVELDDKGQPEFEIVEAVAWDFLEWTPEWQELAQTADAICFGSLAQRAPQSKATVRAFLQAVRPNALRVFDVNLRQSFYSTQLLRESMALADIVKMNHTELATIVRLLDMPEGPSWMAAQTLRREYNLDLVCITRGAEGSLLIAENGSHEHSGFRVKVADTIGAGDAFTAALVHQRLRGASLEEMNNAANQLGSWVASQVGGMPQPDAEQIEGFRELG